MKQLLGGQAKLDNRFTHHGELAILYKHPALLRVLPGRHPIRVIARAKKISLFFKPKVMVTPENLGLEQLTVFHRVPVRMAIAPALKFASTQWIEFLNILRLGHGS